LHESLSGSENGLEDRKAKATLTARLTDEAGKTKTKKLRSRLKYRGVADQARRRTRSAIRGW